MDKLELNGQVMEDGKLNIPLRKQIADWCSGKLGKDIRLILEVRRRGRSNPQNAYYWSVCIPLIQEGINELGHRFTKEETHEFLKKEFNSKEVELENATYIMVPGSTTEMTTVDFMGYIERIQQFAAEMLGVTIPNPNEQTSFDY